MLRFNSLAHFLNNEYRIITLARSVVMRTKLMMIIGILALIGSPASAIELNQGGKQIDVPVCGGFVGLQCTDKQWCNFPQAAACGSGDQFGVCRARPEFCPEIVMPVCGCDGKTYGNACKAAREGSDVAYVGGCRSGS
jgi:Kazal-type serine protease inhibitor domain